MARRIELVVKKRVMFGVWRAVMVDRAQGVRGAHFWKTSVVGNIISVVGTCLLSFLTYCCIGSDSTVLPHSGRHRA
ncbi:hypothetical protein E2C01_082023 [Portunus trituberculatus]|uniref:Uncharacterized protein n=1 Tax=Portunus trituberculatus TaxID=210409 RepID=A0A5B7INW6_PORTR|nr:hypothetical protein [Portunus trituberculatus]